MSLTFRICNEEDIAQADVPFIAAYGFPTSQQKMLHDYWELQPDGWWLVLLDGEPVGFGGAVDYGAFSSIGMLAVHPSVQRRGIGQALMEHILAWGEARGCPTMVLSANPKAVSLYQRLEFVEEGIVPRFFRANHVPLPSSSAPPEYLGLSDLSELRAFDAPIFGAERTNIFVQYLHHLADYAFVTRAPAGHVTGYLFVEQGFFGPWVACTVQDAERLLLQALSLSFPRNPILSLPDINVAGQELLKRYGFEERSVNVFMRFGPPIPQRQPASIYGETSPALG